MLGDPPALTSRQWTVFGLLSLAGFFSVYDDVLRAVCIDDIQRSLSISERQLPFVITLIRCGAIPAFILTMMADMIGRRPLLLLTISAYTLCTAVTAVSLDVYWFTASQFLGKLFLMAEFLVSNVAIIEEFEDGNRGWAMGGMGALATAGGGVALCLYAAFAGTDYGWRIMYVIGVLPLILLTYLRRGLPETRRFNNRKRNRDEQLMLEEEGCERCCYAFRTIWTPLFRLIETQKASMVQFSVLLFLFGVASHPAGFYQFKYLEEERGYGPIQVFMLGVFGGIVAIAGYSRLGQLSDRYGRRPFTMIGYCIFFTSILLFYSISVSWLLPIVWIVFAGCFFGIEILNMTVISESFPTQSRATAQGFTTIAYVFGTIIGLLIEGVVFESEGSHSKAILVLAGVGFVCPAIFYFTKETSFEHLQ